MEEKLYGNVMRLIMVKRFHGSTVDDISYNIIQIILKKPTNMIIHIVTNEEIQDNLLNHLLNLNIDVINNRNTKNRQRTS